MSSEVICPDCGEVNTVSDWTCRLCGHRMDRGTVVPRQAQETAAPISSVPAESEGASPRRPASVARHVAAKSTDTTPAPTEPAGAIPRRPATVARPHTPVPPNAKPAAVSTTARGRRSRGALVLALVVVVAFAGLAIGRGMNPTGGDTGTSDSGSSSTSGSAADDPLGLDADFANQRCSGDYLVILASSGDPAAYVSTLAAPLSRVTGAKYLMTSRSCRTFNQKLDGHQIYAAYVGPFGSFADACAALRDSGPPGAYVRLLSTSVDARSQCSCLVDASVLPTLSHANAAEATGTTQALVTDLQSLLGRAGKNPDSLVGGHFGEVTDTMVRNFQSDQGLPADGVVSSDTWAALHAYCDK